MIRLLVKEDYEKVMEYILRNEVETSFLYGNVVGFGLENDHDKRRCGDYYGFFEDGLLKGILAFYNLGSCIVHYESVKAIPEFAGIMKDKSFEYLQGMKRIIKPLYDEIAECKEVFEANDSFYLVNRDFKPFFAPDLQFVDGVKEKSEDVVDFIIETRCKGFKQTVEKNDVLKNLEQRGAEEDYILVKANGRIVAGACIQTYTPSLNQIGSVYTTEEERGKGYAKAVVSHLCSKIVSRGKIPTLFVLKNNIPAFRAYTALGFMKHDEYMLVRFKV